MILLLLLFSLSIRSAPSIDSVSLDFLEWNPGLKKFETVYFYVKFSGVSNCRFIAEAIAPAGWGYENDTICFLTPKHSATQTFSECHGPINPPWYGPDTREIKINIFLADNIRGSSDTLRDTIAYAIPQDPAALEIRPAELSRMGETGGTSYFDILGRRYRAIGEAPRGIFFERKDRRIRKIINQ